MQRLILFGLLIGLIACNRPIHSHSEGAQLQQEQLDSRLRKISDVPTGPNSYTLQCISTAVCWVGDFTKQWRTDDGGRHWQLVYSAKPNGGEISRVDCIGERVAWLLTLNKLYKTKDAGLSWVEQVSPLLSSGELRAIEFPNNGKIGWVGGGIYRSLTKTELKRGVPNNIYDAESKSVLELALAHTTDGGKTWFPQKIAKRWGRIYGLTFINEQQGIALGSSGTFFTMDGGAHWNDVVFEKACTNESYLEGYDMRALQVFFLDSRNAWLNFEDGRIAKSTDGGKTWCDLLAPNTVKFDYYEKYFKKIHFIDSSHGVGLGANGFLYKTTDGGETWAKALNTEFDDLFFQDNVTAWLVSNAGLYQIDL